MDIVVWLRSLGLGKYEALFREHDIDNTVLLTLTAEDLKELGVTVVELLPVQQFDPQEGNYWGYMTLHFF